MTRIKAVSLFLAVVLVLAIVLAILVAAAFQSSWFVSLRQESARTLSVGVSTPADSSAIAGGCDGCSGGGSGGG